MEIPKIPASRVTVLDALSLDREIHGIFKGHLSTLIQYFPLENLERFEIELDTILRLIVWKLSVEKLSASFGQNILKLKYQDGSGSKLKLLGLLLIGSYYLKERKRNLMYFIKGRSLESWVNVILDYGENIYKVLDACTLIWFLRKGGASTFLERILGLNPVSTIPTSGRSMHYAYMTRELLWHGFIELLVFILPLVNYHSLRRKILNIVPMKKKQTVKSSCTYKIGMKCSVCNEVPVLPHHMGCAHLFCYYCIAAERTADRRFECPECGFSDPSDDALSPVIP